MTAETPQARAAIDVASRIVRNVGRALEGKPATVSLAVVALLARGHLLVEDVPGVGKTTLARALAKSVGVTFRRLQFTSDLMPADVLGGNVLEASAGGTAGARLVFRPGPVFTHVLLADEINRTTPRTQSALLEAMDERRVSLDGQTHAIEEPFFVVATQNPEEFHGTYPLPESQLDRFLMRIRLGYPDAAAEHALLSGAERRTMIDDLPACMDVASLVRLQGEVRGVFASPALIDYVQALLAHTRRSAHLASGLSPRAGLALLNAARAWALIDARRHVEPEDVQAILLAVVGHRLHGKALGGSIPGHELAERLLAEVPVP
jgi:MoxR-like ATPase